MTFKSWTVKQPRLLENSPQIPFSPPALDLFPFPIMSWRSHVVARDTNRRQSSSALSENLLAWGFYFQGEVRWPRAGSRTSCPSQMHALCYDVQLPSPTDRIEAAMQHIQSFSGHVFTLEGCRVRGCLAHFWYQILCSRPLRLVLRPVYFALGSILQDICPRLSTNSLG